MTAPAPIAADLLLSLIERVERLLEEKAALADDVKAVFAEAKSDGFDVKALRKIIRLRQLDPSERQAQAAILETYLAALGML
jgi:uncharacterized protein (UPF0335 family)